ncbi:hypothetical protein HN385_01205 [archaeon]|jgi:hypothetical protein|nr:hypothetical protein [archaeon]MBT6869312.1 hypothetical protein [archaeon]MBT7192475.1 hypothetical protein [archaeon]MBT7380551.1 hypothetical protein [archaeon]MBT7507789.1 hypothetical protein [archaeon]
MNIKKYLEIFILLLFFSVCLHMGLASYNHQIDHEYPVGYFASDPFWHQGATDCLSVSGQSEYYCSYMVSGYNNVLAFNPPSLYHLTVMFSEISGSEIYDIILLLTIFFLTLLVLLLYIMAKKFNPFVALLSLPLVLMIFSYPFNTSYIHGQWIFIIGSFYLVALFWSISKIRMKYSFLLVGLFLAAMSLSHIPEFIFGIIFILIYLTMKKWDYSLFKKFLLSGVIFVPLSFYYLILFYVSYVKISGESVTTFSIMKEASGFPTVLFNEFGILLMIILIIGLIIGFYLLLIKKKMSLILISSFFMVLVGFSNYVGIGNRAFQTRLLWPIYLSLFFGLFLFYLINISNNLIVKLSNKLSNIKTYLYFAITIILLISFAYNIQSYGGEGFMDQYHWEGITFFQGVKPNATVLFVYGDMYNQDQMLWSTWRLTSRVNLEEYYESVQIGEIKRTFLIDPITTYLPYKESFLSYQLYGKNSTEQDICEYDYFLFDLEGDYPILIEYGLLIREKMIVNNEEVFNNGLVSIINNNNPGGDCFE